MEKCKENSASGLALMLAVGATLTIAGLVFIPPLLQKYAGKVYKVSVKKASIDFDNMGPEIVPLKNTEET